MYLTYKYVCNSDAFIILTGCSFSYTLFDFSTSGSNRTLLALQEENPVTCIERQIQKIASKSNNIAVSSLCS